MRQAMKHMTVPLVVGSLLGFAHTGEVLASPGNASEPPCGVVVEEVGEGSALAKVGVEPGDVLLAWRRLPAPPANPEKARGELASPFDWMWLELEQAPRGTLELTGRRHMEARVFTAAPGLWNVQVRPWMPDSLLVDYLKGWEHLTAGKAAEAATWWKKVAEKDWHLQCWILLRLGDAWAEQGELVSALDAYRSALAVAEGAFPESVLWQAIGEVYNKQNEFEPARQAYGSALEIRERAWADESLALAESLNKLGEVASNRRDLERAVEFFQRALTIREELARQLPTTGPRSSSTATGSRGFRASRTWGKVFGRSM